MGYKDQYKQVKDSGEGRNLSPTYKEWDKKGDQIIGRMLAKNAVGGQQAGSTYNQYLFDTDDGLMKFAVGSATDNEAAALMKVGGVYSVIYGGKEKLKGGRQINRFEILEVEPAGDSFVGNQGDIPF